MNAFSCAARLYLCTIFDALGGVHTLIFYIAAHQEPRDENSYRKRCLCVQNAIELHRRHVSRNPEDVRDVFAGTTCRSGRTSLAHGFLPSFARSCQPAYCPLCDDLLVVVSRVQYRQYRRFIWCTEADNDSLFRSKRSPVIFLARSQTRRRNLELYKTRSTLRRRRSFPSSSYSSFSHAKHLYSPAERDTYGLNYSRSTC